MLLPDSLVTAITMHGLRSNNLKQVGPYVAMLMAEIGLNTPNAESSELTAEMTLFEKRYKVSLKCTWELIENKNEKI